MTDFVTIPQDEFIKEVMGLVEKAQREGIILRILGALAIRIHSTHCDECIVLHKALDRLGSGKPMFTDLDLMAYSKQSKQVREFFEKKMGYKPDQYVNTIFGNRRNIFYHPQGHFHVDVFYDVLSFSHDVRFENGRIEKSIPTIPLEELVLEKLQIHQINRKDLVDLFVLFLAHDVLDKEEENKINGRYIAEILSDDWGFWYDATNNLKKVLEVLQNDPKVDRAQFEVVKERINKLLKIIDETPKTRAWEKRAKKGTSRPWYNKVEEVER
jgi:hypothetical protein